jgi:hypothetical protein
MAKKTLKVGQTKITTRKIRGKNRKVRVKKVAKGKYRVRLVSPKANSAGKKYNKGRSWTLDQKQFNKRQKHERRYRKKKKR